MADDLGLQRHAHAHRTICSGRVARAAPTTHTFTYAWVVRRRHDLGAVVVTCERATKWGKMEISNLLDSGRAMDKYLQFEIQFAATGVQIIALNE